MSSPAYLALLAIVLIAVLVEVYPPIGWSLAILAGMAMIAGYFRG